MASIATGIDYETAGETTSTGAAMRAAQPDQSGGTDSGDAATAWRHYGQELEVRDGDTFADALGALSAGRLVHLDVWHASVGGSVCLSGSGGYGHTMAVAPEMSGSRWLVADPWCNPPAWQWVEESRLRAGAEEWGARVYTAARADPEYATGGPKLRRIIVRRVVHELLDRWNPDRPAEDAGETGGNAGGPILFTTTTAGDSGGDDVRFVSAGGYDIGSGLRVNVGEGASWYYLDGTKGGTFSGDASLVALGLPDAEGGAFAVVISTGTPYADKVARPTLVMIRTSNKTYPAPDAPPADCDELVAARDGEWREWLLAGSPGADD
jgi:hypothetical protein